VQLLCLLKLFTTCESTRGTSKSWIWHPFMHYYLSWMMLVFLCMLFHLCMLALLFMLMLLCMLCMLIPPKRGADGNNAMA